MKNKKIFGVAALLIAGAFLGAILVSGFGWVRPTLADLKIGASQAPVTDVDYKAFSKAFVEVAKKVNPSIVQITVDAETKKNPHEDFFFFPFKDFDMPRQQRGSGSGVIISEDGYILTNNHVVENASKVRVTLNDKRIFDATVVGTDPSTDLGVIKIDASGLPAAYLGNSEEIEVGQWVMAIGNPLALTSTVTAGIVSAVGRNINIIGDSYAIEDFIQTDAAINPGNSGGALVDLSGAVIGINTAIATGSTGTYIGYGFAIPINLAKSVSKDLIANGKVNRGYIGVSISEVNSATAKALGLEKPRGVLIQSLVEGGAAQKADVKEGDVILTIDGREVNQPNELQAYIASKRAGDVVTLKVFRDGKETERKVTLKSKDGKTEIQPVMNRDKEESSSKGKSSSMTFDNIGLTVKNMNSNEKSEYEIDNGIVISEVKEYSLAYDQNLRSGYAITEVNKKKINSVSEFEDIVEANKGKAILLKVVDGRGNSVFAGIVIPQ
ncbi:MAG TPA: Do family serine endopeptidase [Ignavibacteriales bacterium]|nr:Do family serine endopeptidase [Ignavibacteriales bacterium]